MIMFEHISIYSGAFCPFFFLRVDEAIIVSKSFEQYWMERRVKSEYIKYFVAGTIHPQLRGVFNSTLTKVTDEWVVEMRKLDVVYLAVVVGILQQESFYLADLTSFEKYRKIELEYAAKIPDAMVMRLGNLRRNNVMLHTMLTSKSGLAVLNAARDTLENLMQYSVSFHHHGTFVYCFLTCIAFTSVDLLAPSIPAESVKLAVVTIESMIAKLKLIKHHSYFGKFGTMLMDVARFHLIKAKAKSIRPIKRIMNLKDVKPKIQPGGELGLIGAMCCALIGLSSHDDNTRRLNSRRAQSMFSEMGSPTLEKWAVGELRYQ
ncbi:hypothetical protein BC829DRAFT_134591 [Chytridium lagenaria]|nr:hypothetical protein BC829DRAFT_134591 [Chytridium lagenaria]